MTSGGKCILKKVRGTRKKATLNLTRQETIYLAIQTLQKDASISIQLLCEIAGIARLSYYKWLNREPSSREQENEQLIQMMMTIYEKVERTFGYRQLTLHMRK